MNKYALLQGEELEKHLSNFLITHWSSSCIADFIQNEKKFEKVYVFKQYSKTRSLPSIIGDVYHLSLKAFWIEFKTTGRRMTYDEVSAIAFAELDKVGANKYRAYVKQTLEESKLEALNSVNKLIHNFFSEVDAYLDEIQEVLEVESTIIEYISINDIEIPLPVKCKCDVIFIDKNGYLCILDHKSKDNYTKEGEINLRYGNQTMCLTLATDVWIKKQDDVLKKYPKSIEGVKRFLYYENKISKNKDGSRQIRQVPIKIAESRQVFEQVLFEGVWRVMKAVQDPDYMYLMNPNDHFEDPKEMMDFWIKTHIEGLEGFPELEPRQRALLAKKRSDIRRSSLVGLPKNVIKSFFQPKQFISLSLEDMENLSPAQRIEHRLATFGYPVKVEHVITGYSCDTYLVVVNAGLKIGNIFKYRMDIANALGVENVRIGELVSYKGLSYIPIEVNRDEQRFLYLEDENVEESWKIPIGKDNYGKTYYWNMGEPSTPHLMIAGASGSGKSITIRTIIQVAKSKGAKIAILDPKYEFLDFKGKKNVKVINELVDIEKFMKEKVDEMDEIFREYGARGSSENKQMIIFDESADCFTRQSRKLEEPEDYDDFTEEEAKEFAKEARRFKTLEDNTLILSQKARSAGIHLVLAAQRFSKDVLKGDAKANFTTRLCLTVASRVDSQVMIDQEGAEKLKGKGDALFKEQSLPQPMRIQCFSQK
jgi:S-DNA-T family DNA segregation ATPase FtsK/SpoIIIE